MADGRTHEISPDTLVEKQLRCAEALLKLLASEKAVLQTQDLEGLQQVCADKAQAAQELQDLGSRLQRCCGSAQPAAIEEYLGRRAPAAAALWQRLRQVAARCQQANLENGALLLERQVRVRSMLQLIQRDERPLYGRGGAAPVTAARRALASA